MGLPAETRLPPPSLTPAPAVAGDLYSPALTPPVADDPFSTRPTPSVRATAPAQPTPTLKPAAVKGKPIATGNVDYISAAPAGPRRIAPADVLTVDVMDNLDTVDATGQLRLLIKPGTVSSVDGDGNLSLGSAYGEVKVAGLTLRQAESAVGERIHIYLLERAHKLDAAAQASREKEPNRLGISADPKDSHQQQLGFVQINVRLSFADYAGRDLARRDLALMDAKPTAIPTGPTVSPYVSIVQARPELIQPGDTLNFEWSPIEALLKQSAIVEPSGDVALGVRYGRVNLAGKTITEAEKMVETVIGKLYEDAHVQITFGARASGDIQIDWDSPRAANANERLEQLEKENKLLRKELLNLRAKQKPTIELPEAPPLQPVDEGKPGPVDKK